MMEEKKEHSLIEDIVPLPSQIEHEKKDAQDEEDPKKRSDESIPVED